MMKNYVIVATANTVRPTTHLIMIMKLLSMSVYAVTVLVAPSVRIRWQR